MRQGEYTGRINIKLIAICIISLFSGLGTAIGQVEVISCNLQAGYITPASIMEATVINHSTTVENVVIESTLLSINNLVILKSISTQVALQPGLNVLTGNNLAIQYYTYSNDELAQSVNAYHRLPAGQFRICLDIRGQGELYDNWCDEIENTAFAFVSLVYPLDQDIISTRYPVLSWTTTEFPLTRTRSDYYELVLVEMFENQDPEVAVAENQPVLILPGITDLQVSYPVSARELRNGNSYAWQVRRLHNGQITDQSQTWLFKIVFNQDEPENKYVTLRRKIEASYYIPVNNKIYFQFSESYPGTELNCMLLNDKNELIKPRVIDDEDESRVNIKKSGDNRFEINLLELDVKPGFHTLVARNNKNEKFYLKILIP